MVKLFDDTMFLKLCPATPGIIPVAGKGIGSGGSAGLQNLMVAAYVVIGGFDSLTLPPPAPTCGWMQFSGIPCSKIVY